MQNSFYLIITGKQSGWSSKVNDFSARLVENKPSLNSDEIAIQLKLEIPVEFFERIMPVVEMKLPKDAIMTIDTETVVALTAPDLSKKLQISLEDATDGLKEMLAKKEVNQDVD